MLNTSKMVTMGNDDGTDDARDATGGLGSWLDILRHVPNIRNIADAIECISTR